MLGQGHGMAGGSAEFLVGGPWGSGWHGLGFLAHCLPQRCPCVLPLLLAQVPGACFPAALDTVQR
eukprot:3314060-Lingulodinium_polyedra.AAC.1